MKAMVLAAGLGLRMRPLTTLRAKPALPVLNRPLIAWTLERLGHQGFEEIIVNTHHLPASVREAARAARGLGLRVSFCHEPRILGTGGGPRRVRRRLGPGPALLVNGDVFFDFDLRALVRRHRASGAAATLALKPNPNPSVYGPVVTASDGRVRSIAGLPRSAPGKVSLFTGVHVVETSLLERLGAGFSDSVRDLYAPMVAAGGGIVGVRVRGAWHDLGDPAMYLRAQMRLLSRRQRGLVDEAARVERSARVRRCVIGPGCHVGGGSRLSGSVLWGGVTIGAGARVESSVLATGITVPAGATVVGRVGIPSRRGPQWSAL
jgi:mannose-1-phosphate guanylyltransferase